MMNEEKKEDGTTTGSTTRMTPQQQDQPDTSRDFNQSSSSSSIPAKLLRMQRAHRQNKNYNSNHPRRRNKVQTPPDDAIMFCQVIASSSTTEQQQDEKQLQPALPLPEILATSSADKQMQTKKRRLLTLEEDGAMMVMMMYCRECAVDDTPSASAARPKEVHSHTSRKGQDNGQDDESSSTTSSTSSTSSSSDDEGESHAGSAAAAAVSPTPPPMEALSVAVHDATITTTAAKKNDTLVGSGVVVRSTLLVQGICCASEVPSVRKIVRSLKGVENLQISIATKQVYVRHVALASGGVRAKDIAQALTKAGFPARVLHDGGAAGEEEAANGSSASISIGQSIFETTAALTENDQRRIHQILENLDSIYQVTLRDEEEVEVVAPSKSPAPPCCCWRILIDHDYQQIPTAVLLSHLKNECLLLEGLVVVQDAQTVAESEQATALLLKQPRSAFVESTLLLNNMSTTTWGSSPLSSSAWLLLLQAVQKECFSPSQVRAIHPPHLSSHTLKVEHNPLLISAEAICEVLVVQYGLDAVVVSDGAVDKLYLPLLLSNNDGESDEMHAPQESLYQQYPQRHIVLSGLFWIISLLSYVTYEPLKYVGLLSVVFGLPPVARKAWRTLRRKELDANCMMVTAAIGAVFLGEFDEAASVSFLFCISEFLESRATNRARKALAEIVNLRPDHANVICGKEIVVIPAERVPIGSLLSVRTGDKIAADGIVVEGTSSLDESSLTGESTPVQKTVGSLVSGGTMNIGSTQLVIKTTSTVADSAVSRLIRLVEEAQANRSPTETMIDGFARAYTPIVVAMAACMATIPWLLGSEIGHEWTLRALILIVISCPCALTISTPVTYAAGLAAMAQNGIIVKGGACLETLGSVDKVIFDKTGTLTEGNFTVSHLEHVGVSTTRSEMLSLLALMESPSSHPLSTALVRAARQGGVSLSHDKVVEMKEHSILKGEGVEATVNGKQVYVGNRRLFERLDMFQSLPQNYVVLSDEWSTQGGTVGFIGQEGEGIIGCYSVIDKIRSEARKVVEELQFGGFEVVMLTGDGEGAARSVANQVGLSDTATYSQLMPEDKLHIVGSLKRPPSGHSFGLFRRQPKVLFCGDGVNDAPALATADIGVAMGEGVALAMEMSDITLMDSNLSKLSLVIKMGSRVLSTVRENIVLSLLCKLAVVSLTFAGYMTLLYAIAADVGVMLLVTLNGMKLLPRYNDDDDAEVSFARSRRRKDKAKYVGVPLTATTSPSNIAEVV